MRFQRSTWRCVCVAGALILAGAVRGEVFTGGAVAADHPLASQAGADMLARGGNAVDAAVAAAFCLSVVRPMSCGIGGGGFMVIRLHDDPRTPERGDAMTLAIDYRETAPSGVGPKTFEGDIDPLASRYSGLAVGVPGTVAGLLHAQQTFGRLDTATVLAPAINAAEEGFEADEYFVEVAGRVASWVKEDEARRSRAGEAWSTLLGGGVLAVGHRIRNEGQARALRLIAEDGASAFYEGPIGEAVVQAVRESGGAMTRGDLLAYRVRERKPLVGTFMGWTLVTMPLPSSGGVTMLEALGIMQRFSEIQHFSLAGMDRTGPAWMHLLSECLKHGFADRAAWLGDAPGAEASVRRILQDDYLDALALRISMARTQGGPDAYGSDAAAPPRDDAGTSHVSVIDRWGGAVACTETINLSFGSRICAGPYGFMLNNEVDDFTTVPGEANAFGLRQSDRNLPAPGKRPLSSMSPTIVLDRHGEVTLVVGASGGPRIITGTLQALLNALLFGDSAEDAVASKRIHHQWMPYVLRYEEGAADGGPFGAQQGLRTLGHEIAQEKAEDLSVVQLVKRVEGGFDAASDPRKGGAPAGVND